MSQPHSKTDLIVLLSEVQAGLDSTVQAQSAEQFNRGTETDWSPSDYLKHLLLSNKPFVKGLGKPKEFLESAFGLIDRPLLSFDDVVAEYASKIAGGVRAEDSPTVVPVAFRMPEDVQDSQAYLREMWNATHANLVKTLEDWSEDDLDRYQIPHPVLGMISIREMLFFTLHHNRIHWGDIRQGMS